MADPKLYPSTLYTLRITKRVSDRAKIYAEEAGIKRLEEWFEQILECAVADRRMRDRLKSEESHYTARIDDGVEHE